VYRGGELNPGREGPISRMGLVPALQAPASAPDLTWIPGIMRSKGWAEGAALMEEWFRRPASIRPAKIKMSRVLGFARAKTVHDKMLSEKIWRNEAGKKEIAKALDSSGITAQF
jgi:hypothetical protein